MTLHVIAFGRAIPQGSVRSLGKGRPSIHGNAATLLPWRQTVEAAARTAIATDGWDRATTGVAVTATFFYDRPRSHLRADGTVKASAPTFPATRAQGDVEKLARGLHDALTAAGVWVDDSQVADLHARKRWTGLAAAMQVPGAVVEVRLLP